MKMILSTLLVALALPLGAVAFSTESSAPHGIVPDDEPINTLCPIGREAIDGSTFVTYAGHRIGLCCPGCDSKFLDWSKADKDAFVAASLEQEVEEAEAQEMPVEPYTATDCPVSGEPLGAMGEPVTVAFEGREAKLCCGGCREAFLADPAKHFEAVDKAITAQQMPYYPMTSCVVSGEPLVVDGEDVGIDVVVKNRLFRVCCSSCVAPLQENPARYRDMLNEKAAEAQRADYPLGYCIVRGEKAELGSMGEPHEIVVGNRLVRFCCKGCLPKFQQDPATFLAQLDAAWAPTFAKRAEGQREKKDSDGGHEHEGEHEKHGGDHH